MKGAIIAYKPKRSHFCTNIWRVQFKFRYRGKLEERTSYVTGINSCGGESGEREASLAVAASYGGQRIKIISAEFLATGVNADRKYCDNDIEDWRAAAEPGESAKEGQP